MDLTVADLVQRFDTGEIRLPLTLLVFGSEAM
jgi:hypothetical protein